MSTEYIVSHFKETYGSVETEKPDLQSLGENSFSVLKDYFGEQYIYDVAKAVGNAGHPDVEDVGRKDYYMCRTANIVGAAQQIKFVMDSGCVKDIKKLQALGRYYRELRRIAARPGLRTQNELKIVRKDIQAAVDLLEGHYLQ